MAGQIDDDDGITEQLTQELDGNEQAPQGQLLNPRLRNIKQGQYTTETLGLLPIEIKEIIEQLGTKESLVAFLESQVNPNDHAQTTKIQQLKNGTARMPCLIEIAGQQIEVFTKWLTTPSIEELENDDDKMDERAVVTLCKTVANMGKPAVYGSLHGESNEAQLVAAITNNYMDNLKKASISRMPQDSRPRILSTPIAAPCPPFSQNRKLVFVPIIHPEYGGYTFCIVTKGEITKHKASRPKLPTYTQPPAQARDAGNTSTDPNSPYYDEGTQEIPEDELPNI